MNVKNVLLLRHKALKISRII